LHASGDVDDAESPVADRDSRRTFEVAGVRHAPFGDCGRPEALVVRTAVGECARQSKRNPADPALRLRG
jgi:hypothetical protein